MVVRVDTTNLARGIDFDVHVHTQDEPSISLYAYDTSSNTLEVLHTQVSQEGVFFNFKSKAPYFDGFVLATINNKSILVKKLGHPLSHFVVGHKSGFTIPYEQYSQSGELVESGVLKPIVDGFYFCKTLAEVTIVNTLGKRFVVKDNSTKLEYEVAIGDGFLDDAVLPNYDVFATLGDAVLPSINLEHIDIDATLSSVSITG